MAEVDTKTFPADSNRRPDVRSADGPSPRTLLGSVVLAVGMVVWASGHAIYDQTAVGAWVLFLVGGFGASIGLRLAVGSTDEADRGGTSRSRWLFWSFTTMLVLVGASAAFEGPAQMIGVSAGVSVLAAGFANAMADLRDTRRRVTELAVIEERQRVAADVHDIVGHALAVTMLHINAARMSLPERPDVAIEALQEAERNGRSSMHEIRGIVHLLRSDDGPSLLSLPDLGDLGTLIDSFTGTGAQIGLAVEIDPDRVSRLASVTTYRLVQEGLTNSVRYGDGPIDLSLVREGDEVVLTIENGIAPGRDRVGGGVGLNAARSRVTSLGGSFEATLVGGNRWRVAARVPT